MPYTKQPAEPGSADGQLSLFEFEAPTRVGATYLTTLYRFEQMTSTFADLRDTLNRDYVQDHKVLIDERTVGSAPALLVQAITRRDRAEWCNVLDSLTGRPSAIGYRSAGSALVVVVDDRVYALTYGTLGRFLIDLKLVDADFGINFAVRAVAPEQIKQIRRRVLGTSGRVDRNLVPAGQHIRLYGIDKWSEIVGQVCGHTNNRRLTACRVSARPTPIGGGTPLRMHLGVVPDDLLADLREIDRVCRQDSPLADLEFITQFRPIPSHDPRMTDIEHQLEVELGLPDTTNLGLAVPGDLVDEFERALSFRVRVPRSQCKVVYSRELTLEDLREHIVQAPAGRRWTALRNGQIAICADQRGTEDVASTAAARWITAQLPHGASQLLLQDGKWYELGAKHREFLRQEIQQILARPAGIALPPWRHEIGDEEAYNQHAAQESGFVLLDRRMLRTAQHSRGRGIEACDLLGPEGELIHVKSAEDCAVLSHLFTQGIASVDALKYEADARQRFVDIVHKQRPGFPIGLDFQPHKVVYAIALKSGKPLAVDTLFTLAQVALYHAVKALRAEGVEVAVAGIPAA